MVRISDILKGKEEPEESKPGEGKKKEPEAKEKSQEYTQMPKKVPEGIQLSKTMAEKSSESKRLQQAQFDPEESRQIYNRAVEIIRDILDKSKSKDLSLDLNKAYEITKIIVDRIVLGDKELIALTMDFKTDTCLGYLCGHLVNVCIISVDLGFGLGYNKSKLNELGVGAFLHDLGLIKVMDIVEQPRALNETEVIQIKKVPLYTKDILSKIKDIPEAVITIATQAHERINGTGYPDGLKGNQIHEYAKIVGVVDVYEALIHPRPQREAFQPQEAIREILSINYAGQFEPELIKLLINRVGLYRVGSWVELNTGEIGKVILSNEDFPLRPKVNIFFDSDKKRLPHMKPIDLSQQLNLYIKRNINPQELNLELE